MRVFRFGLCMCMMAAAFPAWAVDAASAAGEHAPSLFSFQSGNQAADSRGEAATGDASAMPVPKAMEHNGPKSATDKIVEKFMALDADASAGVSLKEYAAMVEQRLLARFAAMDADKNGEVTEDEYRAFWKSRMARWYRLKR